MREAIRLRLEHISPGFDVVVIARRRSAIANYQQIALSLENLLKKAGLWVENDDKKPLETQKTSENFVLSAISVAPQKKVGSVELTKNRP